MDRTNWLREKRRLAEERMDTLFAPIYDDRWGGYINPTHQIFLDRLLALCPPGATILDAACGTGKYWPAILRSGRQVIGVDQSSGMLARASAKHPTVPTVKAGLQDLTYSNAFPGVLCIDALENIAPEDWPIVLHNLARALAPDGYCYCTVELADPAEITAAYAAGRELGLPVVPGEWAHEGSYHYYPSLSAVYDWFAAAGLKLCEEAAGDGYHHILARKGESPR
jgi:ubiquinone/menaquinone biosynthesis C-methylase UbiE